MESEITRKSYEQSRELGEISIFIKTTKLNRRIVTDLSRIVSETLQSNLPIELALVKTEEIAEAQKTGTLRICRVFYKILQAPSSEKS